jgi:hypothetical protein
MQRGVAERAAACLADAPHAGRYRMLAAVNSPEQAARQVSGHSLAQKQVRSRCGRDGGMTWLCRNGREGGVG